MIELHIFCSCKFNQSLGKNQIYLCLSLAAPTEVYEQISSLQRISFLKQHYISKLHYFTKLRKRQMKSNVKVFNGEKGRIRRGCQNTKVDLAEKTLLPLKSEN
jgi:hypothetical protein